MKNGIEIPTGLSRGSLRSLLALVVLVVVVSPASAQPKPGYSPSSTHIFPAGGRRGSKVAVKVGAECIPPGTSFLLFGKGVNAPLLLGERLANCGEPSPRRVPTETPITYPKEWRSQIEIAAEAPAGAAFWRLSCAQGGTAARPFMIGDLPEHVEQESNSTLQKAETIKLPITVNGQIYGERDVDHFRFRARAGQTITCEVLARRLGSRLDPILHVFDDRGRPVPFHEERIGADPVIAFQAAVEGDYVLRIANVSFHGGPAHVYRLNLSTKPFVLFAFPSGGAVGEQRQVEFYTLSASSGLERVQRNVGFHGDGVMIYRDDSLMNDVEFFADHGAHIMEQEPNNQRPASKDARPISKRLTIHGRLAHAQDVDWFAFAVQKDQRLELRCEKSPRWGPAMLTMELQNAEGGTLAHSRGVETPDGVCHIDWTAAEEGVYSLRIRDMQFGARGGADFNYRLHLRPARADFSLHVASCGLNVMQGKETTLEVVARRRGGFNGPIDLYVEGLPQHVQAKNTQIAAGNDRVQLRLAASSDAASAPAALRIEGRAVIKGKTLQRPVMAGHLGVDGEGVGLGPARLDRIFLTVQHEPIFRLFCSEAYLYAPRGSVYPYAMEVERLNGFSGPITLQIGDRQNRDLDGVEMFEVTIPAGRTQTHLPIHLPETMHINVQSQTQLYSQAYATFKDKQGNRQAVLVLSEKRNMLRTRPPVVKLHAMRPHLAAAAGENLPCRFRLERTSNFRGPMELRLTTVSAPGVFARPTKIPAGAREAHLELRLDNSMRTSLRLKLTFRASGEKENGLKIITQAVVWLAVNN